MTDRDLFYCGDFQCDGHARSNERCETIEEATETVPKYTVSGNHLRMFRLDAEGNPTGEPIEMAGPVTFDIPEGTVSDATLFTDAQGFSNITLDIDMGQVDPVLIALLTGQGTPPETIEFEVWYREQPWYKRLLWWAQGMWPWRTER